MICRLSPLNNIYNKKLKFIKRKFHKIESVIRCAFDTKIKRISKTKKHSTLTCAKLLAIIGKIFL